MADLKPAGNGTIIRVLHVDDDLSFLEISKLILIDMNCNFLIDSALSVDEASAKLAANDYDVVVSDYEMPNKNGLDFLRELKKQKKEIPFIIFTGKGREEVTIQAINLGANYYINKQGSPETVYGELVHGIKTAYAYKKAEKLMLEMDSRYRELFDTTPDGIAIYQAIDNGEDFVIKDFNPAAQQIEKVTKTQIVGRRVTEAFPGVKELGLFGIFQQVWKTGQPLYLPESLYKDSKKAWSWRENWVYKLPNNEIVAIYRDITSRKKAQEALTDNLSNYRSLINGMNDTAWVIDFNGNFLEANDSAVRILGYSKEELLEIGIKGIDKNLSQEQVKKLIDNLPLVGNQVFETIHITKDGTEIPVEICSSLIDFQGNQVILSIARNITERKKVQEVLKENEAKYHELSDYLPEVVFEIDSKANLVYTNRKGYELTGYSKEDTVNGFNVLSIVAPEDKVRVTQNIKKVFAGSIFQPTQYTVIRKDGGRVPVIISSAPIIKNDKVVGARGVIIDITERKQAEEKLSTANEKLRVVGKLTRHDVCNKLQVIGASAYLLKKKLDDDPEAAKLIASIETSAELADRLFEFGKLYEQIGVEETRKIDVKQCFNEAVALIPNLGSVRVFNESDGLVLEADSLLRQVFYNLIDNSLKHGKKVTQIRLHYTKQDNQTKLIYEDDGVGVAETNKQKLFIEGFSTNSGTGLGLSLLRKILQVYGWAITEKGIPGKGAKFEITIPKA
jgi:PAS domain S-box-containing protein